MVVYRITKGKHAEDLTGKGSKLYGGRWNQKGIPVIYTSETRALASLELLVHIPFPSMPANLKLVSIEIPERTKHEQIYINNLPKNWKEYPSPSELSEIGTNWINSKSSLLLKVPSVIVEEEYNVLINPLHPDFTSVKILSIVKYELNPRLI